MKEVIKSAEEVSSKVFSYIEEYHLQYKKFPSYKETGVATGLTKREVHRCMLILRKMNKIYFDAEGNFSTREEKENSA